VTEDLEERVTQLEETTIGIMEELEKLVETVEDINDMMMADKYVELVESGRLEEMREKHPEQANRLEQEAEDFLSPIIEEEVQDEDG